MLKIKPAVGISFIGAKKAEVRVLRLVHQGQGKQGDPLLEKVMFV